MDFTDCFLKNARLALLKNEVFIGVASLMIPFKDVSASRTTCNSGVFYSNGSIAYTRTSVCFADHSVLVDTMRQAVIVALKIDQKLATDMVALFGYDATPNELKGMVPDVSKIAPVGVTEAENYVLLLNDFDFERAIHVLRPEAVVALVQQIVNYSPVRWRQVSESSSFIAWSRTNRWLGQTVPRSVAEWRDYVRANDLYGIGEYCNA